MKTYNRQGTKIRALGLLIATAMLLLSACVAPIDQMPAEAGEESQETATQDASGSELTIEQLGNATYSGIYDEPITLTDGVYEGAPLVEGGAARPMVTLVDNSVLYGDLNGDGVADATVLLAENSGGSGVFTYVGAQLNQDGQPADAGTVLLGDRTQIISGVIENEQVIIDMVTQGPDDPMCCPTSMVSNSYALQDSMLAQVGGEEMGNVSLDDLMGTSWVLTSLAQDTPVLPDAPITAAFADGQIAGSAGCNNYSAAVSSEGGQNLTVGPSMSTMMACPDPIMAQETAYLTALQSAMQWSYFIGQLAITYQNEDGSIGVLYYAPATESMAVAGGSDSTADANEFTYQCADDVTIMATFDNDNRTATVTLPDGTQTLPQVEAASGAKYSDGTTTFWTQGDEAFVQVNDETVIDDCTVQAE